MPFATFGIMAGAISANITKLAINAPKNVTKHFHSATCLYIILKESVLRIIDKIQIKVMGIKYSPM